MRSLRLLSSCSVIFCEDTRVTKKLINLLSIRYDLKTDIQKYISLHSHNEKQILDDIDMSIFDKDVAYMSDAGMPCISDPGCYLIEFCRTNNIEYDVLPGSSALTLAYASSGFCQSKFLFYGFLPHKGHDRETELTKAMFSGFVTILYESPHRLLKLIEQICNIDENREIFLIKEATKMYQKTYKSKSKEIFEELKKQTIKGEWVVVLNSDTKAHSNITINDIKSLDIPKKIQAKLISKVTGKSTKECYNELL